MSEDHYKRQREAGEKLAALLALPMATSLEELGSEGTFDPWHPFPLYGSYSADFDWCAIAVLRELQSNTKIREDLGAEMFREMLCNLDFCDYGSSPRVCFPTTEFRKLLPDLIAKWETWSAMRWS